MTHPTHSDLHRDIGKMEAGLEALKGIVEKGFQGTGDRLDKVEQRLASIEAKEAERRGAGKVLVALAGATGAIAAAVVKYIMG